MTIDSSMSASENGHTPRWWVSEATDEYGSKLVFDGEGLVAAVTTDDDARLIAAAPDLLEALKKAKETIRAWHGPNAWEIYDRSSPEMQAINAAISKAEGGAA